MRPIRGLLLGSLLVVGCSSFSTVMPEEDRVDGGTSVADAGPDVQPDGPVNPAIDAGLTLVAGRTWSSPNGALWAADDTGTRITRCEVEHPVLYPSPALPIPEDDYTVRATVVANTVAVNGRSELGLVFRALEDGSQAYVFGTDYGGGGHPFLGDVTAPTWSPDPATRVLGPSDPVQLGQRYHLVAEAHGLQLRAKSWRDGVAEPDWQISMVARSTKGRLVGIYTYFVTDAFFESLSVTVP